MLGLEFCCCKSGSQSCHCHLMLHRGSVRWIVVKLHCDGCVMPPASVPASRTGQPSQPDDTKAKLYSKRWLIALCLSTIEIYCCLSIGSICMVLQCGLEQILLRNGQAEQSACQYCFSLAFTFLNSTFNELSSAL